MTEVIFLTTILSLNFIYLLQLTFRHFYLSLVLDSFITTLFNLGMKWNESWQRGIKDNKVEQEKNPDARPRKHHASERAMRAPGRGWMGARRAPGEMERA